MAYAAGSVTSEYRLSMAKLEGDIGAIERRLKAIKPPQLASLSVETGGQRQVAELARLNAQVAAQQARALADQQRLATQAAVGQQRLAQAQNATAVSAQRVTQAEQQTAQSLSRTAREAAQAQAAQARLELQQLRLANAQQRAAQGGESWLQNLAGSNQRLTSMVGTLGTVTTALGAAGAAFAAVQATGAAIDFARTGASIDAARQSFDNLAKSAGTSGNALLASLQAAASGTVANTDLIKSSNTALLLLGSDVATKLPQLLAVAKASATTLGTDVGQVFDSLVTGISRGSTELIDNAGITVKSAEAYATYAEQIGKSADSLSAAEKQQAILNAVLTAGQDIVARTAGGAEAAATSYQRAEASLANLTASAQVAAANIGAPLAAAFAQAATGADLFVRAASGQSTAVTQSAAQVAATAATYDEYTAAIARSNAVADAQIGRVQQLSTYFGPYGGIINGLGQVILRTAGHTQVLTETQLAYTQALIAGGTAQEEALAKAQAQSTMLEALASVVAASGGELDAYQARLIAAAAASEGNAQAVGSLIQQYALEEITAAQLVAILTGLEESTQAGAAAAREHAAALEEEAQATQTAEQAAMADALAKETQAAAAALTALRHDELAEAIRAAAASGGSAISMAAAIAGQFNGVEAPAVANLIRLHRELQAARAGQTVAANVATRRGRDGGLLGGGDERPGLTQAQQARIQAQKEAAYQKQLQDEITRATGSTADRLRLVNAELAKATPYSEKALALEVEKARLTRQAAQEAERAAKGAAGGGGGGRSPAVKAAEQEGKDLARLDERRGELSRDTQRRLEEQAVDHAARLAKIARESAERQLQIQRQYAERQLAAERQLRVGSLNSRADFYDALTQSTPEIGQEAAEGLAAAYEQAFAQAQQFAQSGQAQLASSYLQLRQRQIQEELSYQQAVARAREEGDQAEVARLQRIEALRAAAREEELKQLVEGGDQNVKARDDALGDEADRTAEALAAEGERYAEQTGKIADASAEKARKLAIDEAKIRGELQSTNTVLAEQLRLAQQLGGLPATGAGLPQAQAAAVSPPPAPVAPAVPGVALAPGQAGGPVVVTDPQIAAQVATLDATVARLAGAVEAQQGILDRIASNTGDTARRVGATRSGA